MPDPVDPAPARPEPTFFPRLLRAISAALITEAVVAAALVFLFGASDVVRAFGLRGLPINASRAVWILFGLLALVAGLACAVAETLLEQGRPRRALFATCAIAPAFILSGVYLSGVVTYLDPFAAMRDVLRAISEPATWLGAGLLDLFLVATLGSLLHARARGFTLRQQSVSMALGGGGVLLVLLPTYGALWWVDEGMVLGLFALLPAWVLPHAMGWGERVAVRVLRWLGQPEPWAPEPLQIRPLPRQAWNALKADASWRATRRRLVEVLSVQGELFAAAWAPLALVVFVQIFVSGGPRSWSLDELGRAIGGSPRQGAYVLGILSGTLALLMLLAWIVARLWGRASTRWGAEVTLVVALALVGVLLFDGLRPSHVLSLCVLWVGLGALVSRALPLSLSLAALGCYLLVAVAEYRVCEDIGGIVTLTWLPFRPRRFYSESLAVGAAPVALCCLQLGWRRVLRRFFGPSLCAVGLGYAGSLLVFNEALAHRHYWIVFPVVVYVLVQLGCAGLGFGIGWWAARGRLTPARRVRGAAVVILMLALPGVAHEVERYGYQPSSLSLKLVQRRATAGEVAAMIELAERLESGDGTTIPQPHEASEWYRRAAEAGDVEAMVRYAYRLEAGRWVRRDLDRARELYTRAAAGGAHAARLQLDAGVR